MNFRQLLACMVLGFALAGCADKLICPAYQSSFIHDKDALRKKFSYFENDSVPKVLTASKTKHLVAVPESYRKRYRKMQTVPMQSQKTVVPDSLVKGKDALNVPADSLTSDSSVVAKTPLDSLSRAKLDSAQLATDSVYVISKDREVRILKYNFPDSLHWDSAAGKFIKEKPFYYVDEVGYNTEQENYMWYFRKQLILPDAHMAKQNEAAAAAKKEEAPKKKSFFQKLMFWKKDRKPKTDSLSLAPKALVDSTDYFALDSASSTKPLQPGQPKAKEEKKPLLKKLFKRKEKTPAPEKPKDPAKKEEDDGF